MSEDVQNLIAQVLCLPREARAALAGQLLESLDGEVDDGAEDAWAKEISARLADAESGKARPVPWLEARKAILQRR